MKVTGGEQKSTNPQLELLFEPLWTHHKCLVIEDVRGGCIAYITAKAVKIEH